MPQHHSSGTCSVVIHVGHKQLYRQHHGKRLKALQKPPLKKEKKLHKWYVNPTIFGFALVKSQHFEWRKRSANDIQSTVVTSPAARGRHPEFLPALMTGRSPKKRMVKQKYKKTKFKEIDIIYREGWVRYHDHWCWKKNDSSSPWFLVIYHAHGIIGQYLRCCSTSARIRGIIT